MMIALLGQCHMQSKLHNFKIFRIQLVYNFDSTLTAVQFVVIAKLRYVPQRSQSQSRLQLVDVE